MKLFVKSLAIMFLLTMAMVVQAQPSAPKPKRIFITLDVSGSMEGNKYVMANYAAQSISVFSNKDDLVYIYYLGKKHDISGANGYKTIHIPFNKHAGQKTYHEISDLTQFLKDYRPDPKYQDWLFVIGDGHWDYSIAKGEYDRTTALLKKRIDNGDFQVCYLQTGDELSECYAFTDFMRTFNSDGVDVRYSDTTASSVLNNCVYFANRILGFSNESIAINQEGTGCLSFVSEFPLDRFQLVYQSKKQLDNSFKMESARVCDDNIQFALKGNPSTRPLIGIGRSALNGMVWELSYPQGVPANENVVICFNQDIDIEGYVLYPYVDINLWLHPYSESADTLQEYNPNQFSICDKENGVVLKLETTDKHGYKFPPPLMQKMEVVFVVEGNTIKATYEASDTTFRASVSMPNDTVSYYAIVESFGYFSRVTDRQIVVKKHEECPPERLPLIVLPMQRFDAVTFSKLIEGNEFGGEIDDSLFCQVSKRGVFDVQQMKGDLDWLSEETSFEFRDGSLLMKYQPRNSWCECAYPDELQFEVTLKSSKGIVVGDFRYEGFRIPVSVPVDRRVWIVRCKNYLIIGSLLILLFVYLIALLKKNRFKKSARVVSTYMELKGSIMKENKSDKGRKLRKKGVGPWIKRWLVPFVDERRSMSWQTPPSGSITFVAHRSKELINISRGSFNPVKMRMGQFKAEENKEKLIEMSDPIRIYRDRNYEGQLTYEPGGADDERTFRSLVITLLVMDAVALGFVVFVLIKSVL